MLLLYFILYIIIYYIIIIIIIYCNVYLYLYACIAASFTSEPRRTVSPVTMWKTDRTYVCVKECEKTYES